MTCGVSTLYCLVLILFHLCYSNGFFTSLLEAIQENLSIGCNLGRPLSKWGAWKWWAEPSFAFNQYWFGKLANIHCSVLMTGCFGVKVCND